MNAKIYFGSADSAIIVVASTTIKGFAHRERERDRERKVQIKQMATLAATATEASTLTEQPLSATFFVVCVGKTFAIATVFLNSFV